MAGPRPVQRDWRPLAQRTIADKAAAAVVGAVSLAALLATFASQKLVEISTEFPVFQQEAVDGLLADLELAVAA